MEIQNIFILFYFSQLKKLKRYSRYKQAACFDYVSPKILAQYFWFSFRFQFNTLYIYDYDYTFVSVATCLCGQWLCDVNMTGDQLIQTYRLVLFLFLFGNFIVFVAKPVFFLFFHFFHFIYFIFSIFTFSVVN